MYYITIYILGLILLTKNTALVFNPFFTMKKIVFANIYDLIFENKIKTFQKVNYTFCDLNVAFAIDSYHKIFYSLETVRNEICRKCFFFDKKILCLDANFSFRCCLGTPQKNLPKILELFKLK